MALTAKAGGGGNYALPPAGTHIARCFYVCDFGTQIVEFQGERKTHHKVRVGFELPTEKHVFDESKGEEPFTVSKEYTLSLHEKSNLRRDLESWRGRPFTEEESKGFGIEKLIGQPCMLAVMHEPKKDGSGKFAKVTALTRPPKGLECPPAVLKPWKYEIEQGRDSVYARLPEWMRAKVDGCMEFTQPKPTDDPTPAESDTHATNDDGGDDVPF